MIRGRRRAGAGPIELIADGITEENDSGNNATVHTFLGQLSTGPFSLVAATWYMGGTHRNVTSITWGGVAMGGVIQSTSLDTGGADRGAGIFLTSGARNGDIVITFDGAVNKSALNKISLRNLQSMNVLDSAFAWTQNVNPLVMSGLASPTLGGIRIAVAGKGSDNDPSVWTWAGATVLADVSVQDVNHRHSVAYKLGDEAGDIAYGPGHYPLILVGAALR
jgi:hypothetical protein